MTQKLATFLKLLVLCSLSCLTLMACTPKRIASHLTAQIMTKGAPKYEMESDIEVASDAAMTLIKIMEVFQHDNPKNSDFNTLLARSYANYCMGFLEFDLLRYKDVDDVLYQKYLKRTKLFYERGKDYGLGALKTNSGFKKALTRDMDRFNRVLAGMGQDRVPELFWTAMDWGGFINLSKDSPLAVAMFPKVEAMMRRVLELDSGYYYGVPYVFFGVSYGSRPAMFGGNLPKAKDYFEKALSQYQRKFLMAHIYYALFYALPIKDQVLYKKLLDEVLETPADVLPQARLANEMAKVRAEWMLDEKNMKRLFESVE
ncbi:MAG: hypothetical protein ACD_62C00544G0004 [uncultured bacterium]|nr:MAG: hypothetical protein ACD_62C00544G0004 [uncultured bacterium]